jgi:nickel superoxide dismutase
MIRKTLLNFIERMTPNEVEAHCDGPCGVYDPAAARIAAEAVLSMTKKLNALDAPPAGDRKAMLAYQNTLGRFVNIKEEQAEIAKREILILWTDYFKPEHLKSIPDLHDIFWKTAKLCSQCKVDVSEQHAADLLKNIEKIHEIFWRTKKREISWYTAA